MIKNVIFNTTKNICIRSISLMSSVCVQHFTAFEVAVLILYYVPWLYSALRSEMDPFSMETNRGKKLFCFFLFFHTDRYK